MPKGQGLSRESYRAQRMARLASGLCVDIGFGAQPNPFLHQAVGLDLIPIKTPENYLAVLQGDALQLPFRGSCVDTILAGEIIEHLTNPLAFLREAQRALKPSGTLVLSTPNPYFPPVILLEVAMIDAFFNCADHISLITPRTMQRLLRKAGLELERIFGCPLALRVPLYLPRMLSYQLIYVARRPFYNP